MVQDFWMFKTLVVFCIQVFLVPQQLNDEAMALFGLVGHCNMVSNSSWDFPVPDGSFKHYFPLSSFSSRKFVRCAI